MFSVKLLVFAEPITIDENNNSNKNNNNDKDTIIIVEYLLQDAYCDLFS